MSRIDSLSSSVIFSLYGLSSSTSTSRSCGGGSSTALISEAVRSRHGSLPNTFLNAMSIFGSMPGNMGCLPQGTLGLRLAAIISPLRFGHEQ